MEKNIVMPERNYFVDSLRFIAALFVCLFHFNVSFKHEANWYREVMSYGWLGVPVFFVISGYCIQMSCTKSVEIKEFLTRRFFRIFPAFWLSLVVVGTTVLFQKVVFGTNSVTVLPKTITAIGATLTLLTSPFSTIKTINWVYWSLTFELFFYAIIALSLLVNFNYRIYYLLAISIIALFISKQDGGLLFFFNHWSTFGLGLSLYYIFYRKVTNTTSLAIFALFSVNLIGLLYNGATSSFNPTLDYKLTAIISVLLISISHFMKTRRTFFTRLGEISYSVYLIHVPIGVYIIQLYKNEIIQQNIAANIVYDLVTYLIVSLLAYLMYIHFELRFIAIGKRLVIKKK